MFEEQNLLISNILVPLPCLIKTENLIDKSELQVTSLDFKRLIQVSHSVT